VCEKHAPNPDAGHHKQRGLFGDEATLEARDAVHDAEVATTSAIIKIACEAWVHAKHSSHLQQRGIFGDAVRHDVRDPKLSFEDLKKWGSTAEKIIKSAKAAYNTFNSRDLSHLQRREVSRDKVRLGGTNIPYELLRKWEEENSRLTKILLDAGPAHMQEHQKEIQELQNLQEEMIKWDLERPRP
jgi:hypothetical protein